MSQRTTRYISFFFLLCSDTLNMPQKHLSGRSTTQSESLTGVISRLRTKVGGGGHPNRLSICLAYAKGGRS